MALQNDPIDGRRPVDPDNRSGSGRVILVVVLVALVLLAIAWAAGLFQVNTDGQLKAPEVNVEGGSVPDVNVETADIDVGTKTETIEVPTVDVSKPGEGPADADK